MLTIFDPKKPIDFVRLMPATNKASIALPLLSVVLLLVLGVNWGIDFAGGTELQVKFEKSVTAQEIEAVLEKDFQKKQVQQYGAPERNEMLIRVERITSMTDEDATRIQKLVFDSAASLQLGAAKSEDVRIDFRADEGDRVTLTLPVPQIAEPAPKKSDAPAIAGALAEKLGPVAQKTPLDDGAIDALSAAGFDRAALAQQASALGYEVTASPGKRAEPVFNALLATEQALESQEKALAKLLDEKSGFKLRRTKREGETEASFEDALQRDEPYQGRVKYLVQFQGVSAKISKALEAAFGNAEVRRVDFVDAKVAEQLRSDGVLAVLIALMAILIYVSVRFNIFFAPGAIAALAHDALIAMLVFPLLGLEFDLPSIAAILTVVGYSINDTIVIYDRIRERMPSEERGPISEEEVEAVVNRAVNETFSRSINTLITTLFASVALMLFTTGAIKTFATVLTVGFLVGGYSSIFVASALFLALRRNFHDPESGQKRRQAALSREEKARGVV